MMVLGLMAAFIPHAVAFAPTDDVWIGIEPDRIQAYHADVQGRLRNSGAWQEFARGEGEGWQARFDEETGTVFRAWGPSIDLGPLRDAADVEAALRSFFARNRTLLAGITDFELAHAGYVERTDTWYVDFVQLADGVPVWRSKITARIRGERLMLFGVQIHPDVPTIFSDEIGPTRAMEIFQLVGPVPLGDHQQLRAERRWLPQEINGRLVYRPTYEVRSRTYDPPGIWVAFVDALTGKLINVHNEVRFLDSTLYATHDTRTVDGSYSTSPVPYARIEADGASVYTGSNGSFSFDGSSGTGYLSGTYVDVRNQEGDEGALSITGASPTWTDTSASQAEIDSYIFLHQIRDWALQFAPEVGIVNDRLRSNVNINSSCNAYYDGSVNFYQAQNPCNNTGRIADVNYHEWGHGFHYYSLEAGSYDGSISEGIGDVSSALQTFDPVIGPYFYFNGSGIRELETDLSYPDDITGEVHSDGLIFAGSVWDLLGILSDTYGESVGEKGTAWEVTSQLFADGIKAGPTIPEAYEEFLVADDDNNNLDDGTPHLCEIAEAFGRHGLGPGAGGALLSVSHAPLSNQAPYISIPLSGDAVNLAPQCGEFSIGSVDVWYSTDDGQTWSVTPLTVAGESFEGELPALNPGTVVQYYIEVSTTEGEPIYLPTAADIAPYTFYVGNLVELYCEPFDDEGGYTHELLDGNEQEGADDWQFGPPTGASGDPYDAYSGNNVWGNDLGNGNYNGAYQPSIVNRLTSPPIDISGYDQVVVQYQRWLNVEDGIYDVARVYANDEAIWENHATSSNIGDEHTEDSGWVRHTLLVNGAGDSLSLGWEIESDQGLEFGGWNIDDVCVYAPDYSNPELNLEVGDFAASDDLVGAIDLSWTQPEDSAATEAIVVRRTDRFAQTREDGEVVFTASGLTPGAPITATDTFTGAAYYTVFAGGGSGWEEGALEGSNADMGYGLSEEEALDQGLLDTGPKEITVNAGCGCSTGAPEAIWGLGGLALLLVRRRRA